MTSIDRPCAFCLPVPGPGTTPSKNRPSRVGGGVGVEGGGPLRGAPWVALVTGCLSLVLWLFGSGTAGAWELAVTEPGGPHLWWPGPQVTYNLDPVGCPDITDHTDLEALRASFQVWSDVECGYGPFYLDLIEDTSPVRYQAGYQSRGENANVVYWVNSKREWNRDFGDDSAVALTIISFYPATGKIVDADIVFNGGYYQFSTTERLRDRMDIQNTMTHEAGHFLGLDHSEVKDAVMYYAAGYGEVLKRDLSADDLDGVCHILPPDWEGSVEGGAGGGAGGSSDGSSDSADDSGDSSDSSGSSGSGGGGSSGGGSSGSSSSGGGGRVVEAGDYYDDGGCGCALVAGTGSPASPGSLWAGLWLLVLGVIRFASGRLRPPS